MRAPPADTPEPDEPFVARAKTGDLDAFDALVRRNQDRIHNLLLRLTGNAADAEDLTQETFLSAFRALAGFDGQSRFSTWLYAIAANAARSHGRRRAVAGRVVPFSRDARGPGAADPPAADPPVGATLERREAIERLQALLNELEPTLREAIVLRDVEGLDYARIARIQEAPLGTVKTRIHRARQALREKMARGGKPEGAPGV